MEKRKRLYLIGIDSAPVWIIRELASKLNLKGFKKFIDGGVIGDLESTLPPITAAAWPSIYTGLTPGEHGVMNFFTLDRRYTKQLTFYDAERTPPFWDTIADKGLKSLIVTPAMVTDPSSSPNVDMVTGFPLKPRFSSDKIEKIANKFKFSGEPEIEQDLKDGKITLKQAVGCYVDSIRARSEFSKHMIKGGDYDLVFVCFTEIDRMQHYSLSLPDWKDYVGPLYAEISKFLEWLISNEDGKNSSFMIVSDHGAQPIRNKLLLNTWLIDAGYAKLSGNSSIGGAKIEVTTKQVRSDSEGLKDDKYKEQLQLSERQPATRFICASVVENDYEGLVSKKSFDMKKTRAFASLSNNPVSNIWVNDSRFEHPAVSSKERKALVSAIGKGLMSIRHRGEKVIERIHDGSAYYKGSALFIEPDIIVEAARGYTIDVFNHSEDAIGEPEPARRGDHTRQGVFAFYSASSKVDSKSGISVLNICPTILDYYGVVGKGRKGGSLLK